MRTSALVAVALLVACSKGPKTAPGPLGEVDLAAKLPAGVTPAEERTYEATHPVCVIGKDDVPAMVRVKWKTLTKSGASYVTWYSVDLLESAPALQVALEKTPALMAVPANQTLTAAIVTIKCTRRESSSLEVSGNTIIYALGDGNSSVKK